MLVEFYCNNNNNKPTKLFNLHTRDARNLLRRLTLTQFVGSCELAGHVVARLLVGWLVASLVHRTLFDNDSACCLCQQQQPQCHQHVAAQRFLLYAVHTSHIFFLVASPFHKQNMSTA